MWLFRFDLDCAPVKVLARVDSEIYAFYLPEESQSRFAGGKSLLLNLWN